MVTTHSVMNMLSQAVLTAASTDRSIAFRCNFLENSEVSNEQSFCVNNLLQCPTLEIWTQHFRCHTHAKQHTTIASSSYCAQPPTLSDLSKLTAKRCIVSMAFHQLFSNTMQSEPRSRTCNYVAPQSPSQSGLSFIKLICRHWTADSNDKWQMNNWRAYFSGSCEQSFIIRGLQPTNRCAPKCMSLLHVLTHCDHTHKPILLCRIASTSDCLLQIRKGTMQKMDISVFRQTSRITNSVHFWHQLNSKPDSV